MMTVGERISIRRKELGMTQEELAIRAGYKSKSSINKIEGGTNDTTLSKLEIIAEILCTSPCFLMGWEETDACIASPSKTNSDLSSHERTVITAYRDQPEMQPAVCKILSVSCELNGAENKQPDLSETATQNYPSYVLETAKKQGASPEFVVGVIADQDNSKQQKVADGTLDYDPKMHSEHHTDREDEPAPKQKKKPEL